MRTVGLVPCSKSKLDRPSPAAELYTGALFQAASAHVAGMSDEWFILSAKHGLVHPATVLAPYDLSLNGLPAAERLRWPEGVLKDLEGRGLLSERQTWLVLAGKLYRRHIIPQLPGTVQVPLDGLGLGEQLASLKALRGSVASGIK